MLGRKTWHLVPPRRLHGALAEAVGPFVYPVEAWQRVMSGKPLGSRPLRCVQSPGDVLYFPDEWWHATMNLDAPTYA